MFVRLQSVCLLVLVQITKVYVIIFFIIILKVKLNILKGKTTTKSDEYTLMITDKFGSEKSLSSKVADFNREL